MIERLRCLVRGHTWQTTMDAAGSISWCSRCGLQHHARPAAADIHFRSHPNLAYEFTLGESDGDGTREDGVIERDR